MERSVKKDDNDGVDDLDEELGDPFRVHSEIRTGCSSRRMNPVVPRDIPRE